MASGSTQGGGGSVSGSSAAKGRMYGIPKHMRPRNDLPF